MWKRVRGWVEGVPYPDVHERRIARTVQALALLAAAWTAANLAVLARSAPERLATPFGVVNVAVIPLALASVALVRRGRHRTVAWLLAAGLTLGPAVAFATGGLAYGGPLVRLVPIPLVVAALVLGRRGLWAVLAASSAGLVVAALRDAGLLGPAPSLPPETPPLGILAASLFTLVFLAVALDGLGASLHRSLLEHAREAGAAATLARAVAADERRWRALVERVHLLVVGVDRDGAIDLVNPWFCEVTGYRPADVVGRPYLELVGAGQRAAAEARLAAVVAGAPSAPMELRVVGKDGSERVITWSAVPRRDPSDAYAGIVAFGTDVTEQRAAEAARDASVRDLERLKTRLEEENLYLREELDADLGAGGMVGESDALRRVLLRVRQVAPSDTTVLVDGETGVGKELVARAVHEASGRAASPFVRVNCAALPAPVVESELFGHEVGAFTGATRLRKGRFELANGGTLFLDEIGELPLELQAKLLRVLQDGEFERVGGTRTLTVKVRVIAATNRDLRAEVAAGRFRADLYYRLNVFPITVPPLRERREDIPLLVRHFVPQLAARTGHPVREMPGPLMRALVEYRWPGNVRELRNVLERAVLQCTDGVLRLPEPLERGSAPTGAAPTLLDDAGGIGDATLEEVERRHILATLQRTGGRVSGPAGAAVLLGINANTLRSRMKKLGIRVDRTLG